MLLAALRRFLTILAITAAGTALASLALGAIGGASLSRSVSLGFYVVGAFLLVAGFFIGNRGPARAKREVHILGPRFMRWATREETEDALNTSALFVALGFVLVLLGLVADTRVRLF